MKLEGIPIPDTQCISESINIINNAFIALSSNILQVSNLTFDKTLSALDSSSINLEYITSTKTLTSDFNITALEGQRLTYNSLANSWVGARNFPFWNSTEQTKSSNFQIGNRYVNFQNALIDVIRTNQDICGDRVNTPSGTYSGGGSFVGGVLLSDGTVFCVPFNSSTAKIYNPNNNTIKTLIGNINVSAAFYGGVLLPNGNVFCVPFNSTSAGIYDPTDIDTVNNFTLVDNGSWPGSGSFSGGVLMSNGRVFCVPGNSTIAKSFDFSTNTSTNLNGTYPGLFAFLGGVLLPNGSVFCVPYNSVNAFIYNPSRNNISIASGVYPGSGAFAGGVLMPNGKVFCVPFNSPYAYTYDPLTDTTNILSETFSGSGSFLGGVLLPNGNVFCVPYNSAHAYMYNSTANKFIKLKFSDYTTTTGKFAGGVLLYDGTVFCVPHNSTSNKIHNTLNTYSKSITLDTNFVTSPFVNKL